MSKIDIYQQLTDRIIEKLKEGTIPWKKPWKSLAVAMPQNFLTKHKYRGANFWNLLFEDRVTPYWLTFKQIKQLGGKVKKGQKGMPLIFWKMIVGEKDGKEYSYPIAKRYYVWNLEQTDIMNPIEQMSIETYADRDEVDITNIELFIKTIKDKVAPYEHSMVEQAYYNPNTDSIMMPDKKRFDFAEPYYATLFHEMGHSTGHKSRLNRTNFSYPKGSPEYAREELVAELVSCFLCETVWIVNDTIDNAASYINSWIKVLQNDNRIIYDAMKDAFKVLEYLKLVESDQESPPVTIHENDQEQADRRQ